MAGLCYFVHVRVMFVKGQQRMHLYDATRASETNIGDV